MPATRSRQKATGKRDITKELEEVWKPVAGSLPRSRLLRRQPPHRERGRSRGDRSGAATAHLTLRPLQALGILCQSFFVWFCCYRFCSCMKTLSSFVKLLLIIRRKSCFSHCLLKSDALIPLSAESSVRPRALVREETPAPTREFLRVLSKTRQAAAQCWSHRYRTREDQTLEPLDLKCNPAAYSHIKKKY